jgi:hypothetical protein
MTAATAACRMPAPAPLRLNRHPPTTLPPPPAAGPIAGQGTPTEVAESLSPDTGGAASTTLAAAAVAVAGAVAAVLAAAAA